MDGEAPEVDEDLLLAMQLQAEEEEAAKNNANGHGGSLFDELRKAQEEEDMKLAMQMQNDLYGAGGPPKPPPAVFSPPPTVDILPRELPEFQPKGSGAAKWLHLHDMHHVEKHRNPPTPEAVKRIMSDYQEILKGKSTHIHVSIDEDDVTHVSALVIGPEDTPYADGFFHFDMIYPSDYPWKPPHVVIVTTANGSVRFNPNLYSNGKVCLSILGTWSGPSWTSVQTMNSTLISIQSLMNYAPYHNEPGFEVERHPGDVEMYNKIIQHETLRVAVCGMMENPTCDDMFIDVMENHFMESFEKYIAVAEKYCVDDGKVMKDPFGECRGKFNFKDILRRLNAIKSTIETKKRESDEAEQCDEAQGEEGVKPEGAEPQNGEFADPTANLAGVAEHENKPEHSDDDKPSETREPRAASTSQNSAQPGSSDSVPPVEVALPNPSPTNQVSAPTTPPAKPVIDSGFLSAALANAFSNAPASGSFDADAQLAALLQAEFNAAFTKEHNSSYVSWNNKPAGSPGGSAHKVKPPKIDDTEEAAPAQDESYQCMVCRSNALEYITLPNCTQPHVYCVACANKMLQAEQHHDPYNVYRHHRGGRRLPVGDRNEHKKMMCCVLCKSVNYVDARSGVEPLKRIRPRKNADPSLLATGICAEHQDAIIMFCIEHMQLICPQCLLSDSHKKHSDDKHLALEDAVATVKRKVGSQVATLNIKKQQHEEFQTKVGAQRAKLQESAATVRQDLQNKLENFKKLLDTKFAELTSSIKSVEQSKDSHIEGELTKATNKITAMNKSIALAAEFDNVSDPLQLLVKVEQLDDDLRVAATAGTPEAEPTWFSMPKMRMNYLEEGIKSLKYKDGRYAAAMGFPDGLMMDYDEDFEGEQSGSSDEEHGAFEY